jgi:hypothetical protein
MKSGSNFIFGIVAFIVFLVIIFIIIVTVRGDKKNIDNSKNVSNSSSFDKEKARGKTLKFSILGGVKADEKYKTLEMTVSPYSRNIRVTKTYTNEVEKEDNLSNNQTAYDAFFAAVDSEGFFETKIENRKADNSYACPTQKRYRIEVADGSEILHTAWTAFCDDTRYGTYDGYVNDIEALFKRQFPDYRKFMSGVKLN